MGFDKNKYSTNISSLKDLTQRINLLIADVYEAVAPSDVKSRKGIKRMVMSDVEIITMSIGGELMTIDSERAWYSFCRKNLNDIFPALCERSWFNRVRRNLHAVIRHCYEEITALVSDSQAKIVDSMPLSACKSGRAHFHKTFWGHGASYGRCASNYRKMNEAANSTVTSGFLLILMTYTVLTEERQANKNRREVAAARIKKDEQID